MAVRKGLGRGLDLLIPKDEGMPKKSTEKNKENKEPKENQVLTLSIHDVEPNRNQPRKQFDEDAIEELADSIKQYGVIQPLIVQKKDKYYEIIAGERRWRACKKAGLKEVPVIIKNYDEKETLKISLIENLQREDLNPIEEAKAYEQLYNTYGLKQDEIAASVSKSRTAITNIMRLLKLDERVQNMVIENLISSGHGRTLLSIDDGDMQYQLAEKILDENLSVREAEKLESLNPDLYIEGVVFTMYDARTNLSLQVVENVKDNLKQTIYKTIIPRNVRLAEAPSYGLPINLYDKRSSGAEAYRMLADEVIENAK